MRQCFPIFIHNIGHHATEYCILPVAHAQWKLIGAWEKNVLRLQNMRIKVLPIHIFTCAMLAHAGGGARACAARHPRFRGARTRLAFARSVLPGANVRV
jgi:hypothetical protein